MISAKALLLSRTVAENATYNSVTLRAENLLKIVTDLSLPPLDALDMSQFGVTPVGDNSLSAVEALIAKKSSTADATGIDRHTTEFSVLSGELRRRVEGSIQYARSVVTPKVRETIERIIEAKTSLSNNEDSFQVITCDMPAIYRADILRQMIEPYVNTFTSAALSEESADVILSNSNSNRIVDTLKTGIESFDVLLNDFIVNEAKSSLDFLIAYPTHALSADLKLGDVTQTNIFEDHSALRNFLFLDGVVNGRLADVDIEDLPTKVRSELLDARAGAARALYAQIARMEKLIGGGAGNISMPFTQNGQIYYVNRKAYTDWIKNVEGASLGVYAAFRRRGTSIYDEKNVLFNPEQIARLTKEWDAFQRSQSLSLLARTETAVIDIVRSSAMEIIASDIVPADQRAERTGKVIDYLRDQPYRSYMPVHVYVRKVMCLALDPANDSANILATMETYMETNKDANPNEAALVAAIDLLVKWASKQITVTKA